MPLFVLPILLLAGPARSQSLPESSPLRSANELSLQARSASALPALGRWEQRPGGTRPALVPDLIWADSAVDARPLRSPRLSFVLSAIVPGAGQLYNGSRRGYVFLALEAASWFTRSSFLDAADRKESDSRAFADRHWDFSRFVGAENAEGCGFAPGADALLTRYLATDADEYYKELATGDDYRCGWDDAALDPAGEGIVSARRADYRDQREKSNTYRNRAGLALGVIVLNRVVSAVDAFRLARGRELGDAPSLRLTSELGGGMDGPRAVFRLTKEFP